MSDVRYIYDGTEDGLFCCLYQALHRRDVPAEILPQEQAGLSLFTEEYILPDADCAARMRGWLGQRLSPYALSLVQEGMLCRYDGKERLILDFVRLALHYGPRVTGLAGNATVDTLQKAVLALHREAHQYLGFVRFSDYDGVLCAVIEPKNSVLSLIGPHFCDRYPRENFMIYDQTHRQALLHTPQQTQIVPLQDWQPNAAGAQEERYRSLWRLFYRTVAIAERENPRCRMSHMQKRYWSQLTEMQPDAADTPSLPA